MFAQLSIDTVMPFGKHKGIELVTLYRTQRGYVRWLMKQEFMKLDYPQTYNELRIIIKLEKLYGEIGLLQ